MKEVISLLTTVNASATNRVLFYMIFYLLKEFLVALSFKLCIYSSYSFCTAKPISCVLPTV
jgi:hypothetical protein